MLLGAAWVLYERDNPKLAVAWHRKASQQGHPTASYNLGLMLQSGVGVEPDPNHAAEAGQADAMLKIPQ